MTWWTDYNLTYSEPRPTACRVDVGAWVTIVNQSGASYADAKLKLIAGRRAARAARRPRLPAERPGHAGVARDARTRASRRRRSSSTTSTRSGRPTSLAQNSTKQIELFPTAAGVGCEKKLVYYGQGFAYPYYGSPMIDRNLGTPSNKKVDVYLRVKNAQANGLGVPLARGEDPRLEARRGRRAAWSSSART